MTNKQKKQIGGAIGISIIGFLVWYIFMDGKEKIKVSIPFRRKTPRLDAVDSGSSSAVSSGSSGSSGQTSGGYKPQYPMGYNSAGPDVKVLQSALSHKGFSLGQIDGIWGPKTQQALVSAVGQYGIPIIRDKNDLNSLIGHIKSKSR